MDLNQREHSLGLSYVAVSRVKALSGVLFEAPFDFEHFTHPESTMAKERNLDHVFRSSQLL